MKVLILLFPVLGAIANADPIFSVSGPLTQGGGIILGSSVSQIVAQSWTTANSNMDVVVSVALSEGGLTGEPAAIDAYLMNDIGPSATVSNQLAFQTFSVLPGPTATFQIFSGLNLPAGTYYLVLEGFAQTPTNDEGAWSLGGGSTNVTTTLGPGDTTSGWFVANTLLFGVNGYAPASTFRNDSDPFFGDVPGPIINVFTAPEGSPAVMLGLGILGIGLRRIIARRPILGKNAH